MDLAIAGIISSPKIIDTSHYYRIELTLTRKGSVVFPGQRRVIELYEEGCVARTVSGEGKGYQCWRVIIQRLEAKQLLCSSA